MVHQRQRLALRLEARHDRARVHAQLDDLERDAAAHRLLLLGHIDHAAAALPDFLQQLIATDPVAGVFADLAHQRAGVAVSAQSGGRMFQKTTGVLGGAHQGLDPAVQGAVRSASGLEVNRASFWCVAQERLREHGLFGGSGLHGSRFIAHKCAM